MIPKNKAMELVKKFRLYAFTSDYDYAENGAQNEYYNAQKCALIAVDEILDSSPMYYTGFEYESNLEYWQEVKSEIKKL